MSWLQQLFPETQNLSPLVLLTLALRLFLSGLLGTWITLLYRMARPEGQRQRGLVGTLVLLTMLITLVTIAVGSNVAVAFTLVGTLAIVRFRTTVSDVRDTTFVIFAVAIGIAVGQSVFIAAIGVVVLSLAIFLLSEAGVLSGIDNPEGTEAGPQGDLAEGSNATLRITIVPPNTDAGLYLTTLEQFGVSHQLQSVRAERDESRLRVLLLCHFPDLDRSPEIVTALLERPEVIEARVTLP